MEVQIQTLDHPPPAAILKILADLQNCLEREAASLIQPDIPDLMALAAEKSHYLEALLPLERAFSDFASRMTRSDEPNLVRRWAEDQWMDANFAVQLVAAFETCQRLNQLNGAVLFARHRQIALQLRALGVLPEDPLYTARGSMIGGRRGMTSMRV